MSKILSALILAAAIFTFKLDKAHAGQFCALAFNGQSDLIWQLDPKLALRTLLEIQSNPASLPAKLRIAQFRINWLASETQIRLLVRQLFEMRYGNMNKYGMLMKTSETVLDAQVTRLLNEEVAYRGLRSFFESRNMLRAKDRFDIKIRAMLASPEFERIGSMLSLLSIHSNVPWLTLPTARIMQLTPRQIEILLVEGRGSEAGQQVMREIAPLGKTDFRYSLVVGTFNKLSLLVALYFLSQAQDEIFNSEAVKNGLAVIETLRLTLSAIEARIPKENLTPLDIEYDEIVNDLTAKKGRLHASDLVTICHEVRAPNRCK